MASFVEKMGEKLHMGGHKKEEEQLHGHAAPTAGHGAGYGAEPAAHYGDQPVVHTEHGAGGLHAGAAPGLYGGEHGVGLHPEHAGAGGVPHGHGAAHAAPYGSTAAAAHPEGPMEKVKNKIKGKKNKEGGHKGGDDSSSSSSSESDGEGGRRKKKLGIF